MVRVGLLSVVRGNNRAILREVYKPVMADAGDKGDRLVPQSDKNALQGQPDAQAARNAGVQDVKAAEAVRTNQSDGSLRKYADRERITSPSAQRVTERAVTDHRGARDSSEN